MDSEPYNKSQGGGRWWVDQCGWGRGFKTEEAADEHIATMERLTAARRRAKVVPLASPTMGRKRWLDNLWGTVLD